LKIAKKGGVAQVGGPARFRAQAETFPTTISKVMGSRGFRRGVEDYRKGRPFDSFADDKDDVAWAYERGRMWGAMAPRDFPLMIRGKVNPKAVAIFLKAEIL
jgi:hypothetical protein